MTSDRLKPQSGLIFLARGNAPGYENEDHISPLLQERGRGEVANAEPTMQSLAFAQTEPGGSPPGTPDQGTSAARSPGPRAAPAAPACPPVSGPLVNSRFASSSGSYAPLARPCSGLPSAVVSAHPVLRLTRQDNRRLCTKMPGSDSTSGRSGGRRAVADGGREKKSKSNLRLPSLTFRPSFLCEGKRR